MNVPTPAASGANESAPGSLWSALTAPGEPFAEPPRDGVPAVCLNMVVSVDGATTIAGRVGHLTGPADQALLRRLRAESDAVLVGAQTVRAEGYGALLGVEERRRRALERGAPEPLLCVVSRGMSLPADSPALGDAPGPLVFLTSSEEALPAAARPVAAIRSGAASLELRGLLRRLREEYGVERVVCEGGPTLNAALFEEGLVQEMFVALSPLLAREPMSHRLAGADGEPVPLELVSHAATGDFLFLRYRRRG